MRIVTDAVLLAKIELIADLRRFWGIFFIDASSVSAAEQGLLAISRKCSVEQSVEGIRRWLSNQNRPWLLIFDNADDPQLDIARFFPAGERGTILVTTRNPECKIHATMGSSELDQMALDEAITLLLRASLVTNPEDETSRNSAKHIVETLGCLALAIVHAGATIRQGVCTLDDYCTEYSRHRKQLLDRRPVQAGTDYEHTVYSTWEVSIEGITGLSNETAKNAIELLNFFSVLHFEGISEQILEKAWKYSHNHKGSAWIESQTLSILNQDSSEKWNPRPFREAIALLSSYSLIHIDGMENKISLHPLVHVWIRDRLPPADRNKCYIMSTVTLSRSIHMTVQDVDPLYVVNVEKHIDSCLRLCQSELWVEDDWSKDRIEVAHSFGLAYRESNYQSKKSKDILERALEYSKKTKKEEDIGSLCCTRTLGMIYFDLGERQKGLDLLEKALNLARNTLGPEDSTTLNFMLDLVWYLLEDDRFQESLDLVEELQILEKNVLVDTDPVLAHSMILYAEVLSRSGDNQKAVELLEDQTKLREESLGIDHRSTLRGKSILALAYSSLNRWQEAAKLQKQVLESNIRVYGTGQRTTLVSRFNLAISYENLDRSQDAIRILTEAADLARNIYGHENPLTIEYVERLKRMQARYDWSLANQTAESSSSSRWPLRRFFQSRRSGRES